jgi:hypothetical protein
MTDKEWKAAIAEIESLRFQLVNNIMPLTEREDLRRKLTVSLCRLARRDMP